MRDFVVSVKKGKQPLYLRIASGIRDAIRGGLILPSELLPSCRTLALQIGANRHTVMAALDQLIAEGWIQAEERKGYRIAGEQPSSFFTPKIWGVNQTSSAQVAKKIDISSPSIKWDFRSGSADLRLFPINELKTCINESLRRNATNLLGYGDPH